MVSLPASTWRDLLSVTSHHQMFPNKPPYQRMTSVSPLPSYMSGYLHQLGGHSSGVYSYVSLPRLLDTRRLDSPPQASVDPLAQRAMKISCERVSTIDGAYVKRREKLKNKISSKRRITVDTLNDKNKIHFKKTGKLIEKKVPKIPTNFGKQKVLSLEQPTSIEEWTEKLLEEARDDLEMVSTGVQTDLTGDSRDQETQTDAELLLCTSYQDEEQSKLDLTVTGLACHAVKQSLYEILQEEVENF